MSRSAKAPVLEERPVGSLFAPRSAVVIGASSDPAKWGGLVAEKLLRGADRRSVFFVNRSGAEILGRRSYPSVADLPEAPEFAAITVPRAMFANAVDDALACGVKAIVGMTSGFGETGEAGAALQAQIVERVRAAGGVLLGPNCMGVYDSTEAFDCLPWAEPASGSLGVISQSGSLIMDIARRAQAYGLGLSRAASIGNQSDVTIADLVTSFAAHPGTDVIAIYCEDVLDGRALFQAVHAAVAGGTPVVIVAPAASDAAGRAARSHTGALLSDRRVMEAAAHASGAVLVDSIRAAVEAAHAVRSPVRGRGRRAAVVSDAGGLTVLGGGAATAAGFSVPTFSDSLVARLAELSMPGAGLRNPVDIVGVVRVDEFAPVLDVMLESDEVDAVLANIVVFNSDSEERERAIGARIADAARRSGKPLAIATPDLDNPGIDALRDGGIPVYGDVEVAAAALRVLCREPASGPPPLPPAQEPLPGDASSYFGARRLLSEHGLQFPPAEEVRERDEAVAAAEGIGYPVVLKALGALHKSDAGGVVLGLAGTEPLVAVYDDLRMRLNPPAFSVERMAMASDPTELIVGGRNDPRFGPLVIVGLGGVFSEVLDDVAVALAPVDEHEADALVRTLKGAPLLLGARGRRQADLAALARAIATISRVVALHPGIAELDVNPLLASVEGAVALDARIVTGEAS